MNYTYIAEFFVRYIQKWIPTTLLRMAIRLYMLFAGWGMRMGNVVVRQIETDRRDRVTRQVTKDVDITNDQLYAIDPSFFMSHLGPMLKYSSCEFPTPDTTLAEAEAYTVNIYQEKAGLRDLSEGSKVLELGCGWGSLSLANAERFPKLKFTAFSNSPPQIEYIKKQAQKRGLTNLRVTVEDFAVFVTEKSVVAPPTDLYDAAIAIETIEHAQNIASLLSAVSRRLKPGAKLFVQSLLHQSASYILNNDSWMGRNFFTAGSILSLNSYFHLAPHDLFIVEVEPISGIGYSRTLSEWLYLLETHREKLVTKHGESLYEKFRMFYLSCSEAFRANAGAEFMCAYYTFVKRDDE